MLQLQDLLAPTDVLLISDEVYEHMVFDGQQHQSAARFPGLAARASSSAASARPTTSPDGKSARWWHPPP
ncbi:methionine aminotransferase [Hydrogenophaga sp. T4]|nr:methionine aminotransferase [Hydrogenophaga sp. T4]